MSTVRDSPQAADVPQVAEDAHFPAGTEGQVYYLHSGSLQELKGKCTIYTAENHGVGPEKKKWCLFHAKQEIRTKNRLCCVATLSGERI